MSDASPGPKEGSSISPVSSTSAIAARRPAPVCASVTRIPLLRVKVTGAAGKAGVAGTVFVRGGRGARGVRVAACARAPAMAHMLGVITHRSAVRSFMRAMYPRGT